MRASRRALSPIPARKSSATVRTIYLASKADAELRSSAIKATFLCTVPSPSMSATLEILSTTFLMVKTFPKRVFCFFLAINFSATSPRSPSFRQLSSIVSLLSPVAWEITLRIS